MTHLQRQRHILKGEQSRLTRNHLLISFFLKNRVKKSKEQQFSRRKILRFLGLGTGAAIISACSNNVAGNILPGRASQPNISIPVTSGGSGGNPQPTATPGTIIEIQAGSASCSLCDDGPQFYMTARISVDGKFHQNLLQGEVHALEACADSAEHALAADATALVGAIKSTWSTLSTSPNAPQLNNLMLDYAAGEIAATEFVIGVCALLSVSDVVLILAAAGLTLWSVYSTVKCLAEHGG